LWRESRDYLAFLQLAVALIEGQLGWLNSAPVPKLLNRKNGREPAFGNAIPRAEGDFCRPAQLAAVHTTYHDPEIEII
jgi:hypothetical protein